MNRKALLRSWLRFIIGLLFYGFGVYLTVHAAIGVAPWEVLTFGIMNYIHFSYGSITVLLNMLLLLYDWRSGEKLGFGTVFDAVLTGYFCDFFMWWDPIPAPAGLPGSVLCYCAGLAALAVGCYFAISSGQGCGPKDALVLALGRRLKKLSMGNVQLLVQASVFLLGFLLGGPVGLGTLLSVTLLGFFQQTVYNCVHYEARDTRHMGLAEGMRLLLFGEAPDTPKKE